MRRRPTVKLRGLFATLAAAALAVSVSLAGTQFVLAAPGDPDFTVTPQTPVAGQPATFTATNLRPNDRVEWDFEYDGSFDPAEVDATGPTATYTYASPGQRTVLMRVVTKEGVERIRVLKPVQVNAAPAPPAPAPNQPPLAAFTASPNPATVGQTVQFNGAGSSDPDGTIASYAWDLDNDGQFDDASGATASRSFATPGTYTVRLRVTDNRGAADTATSAVTVNAAPAPPAAPSNQAPFASLTVSPNPATVGQTVQFNGAGSSDPDGVIASYAWDLDNDGEFDDASGVAASRSFASPGTYTVRLRVTDNRGATDIATSAVTVNAAPAPPAAPSNQAPFASDPPQLGLMTPFPVVRIVGRLTRDGTRIKLLVVRSAPRGATVRVRCRGRRCRLRQTSKAVRSGSVRFRSFERRVPAGARIQVFITQPGKIGKYTSFKIRLRRRPVRTDLCVTSATAKPQPCPML